MSKKKVSIFLRAKDVCPSGYYRLLQYFYKMQDVDLTIHSVMPPSVYLWYHSHVSANRLRKLAASGFIYLLMFFSTLCALLSELFRHPDVLIVQREVLPRLSSPLHLWLLRRFARRSQLIWDFDDDIFQSGELTQKEAKLLIEESKHIIVTSEYLRSHIPAPYLSKVMLLPTTDGDMQDIPMEQMMTDRKNTFETELRMVWVATRNNIEYLVHFLPTLDEAAKRIKEQNGKQLTLEVVTSLPIPFEPKHLQMNFHQWTHDLAIQKMISSHIGIMPLLENPYTLGKGGFKLIQYMSVALPVIASEVGYNSYVVDSSFGYLVPNEQPELWVEYLLKISSSWSDYLSMSTTSKRIYDEKFSYRTNYQSWLQLIQDLRA